MTHPLTPAQSRVVKAMAEGDVLYRDPGGAFREWWVTPVGGSKPAPVARATASVLLRDGLIEACGRGGASFVRYRLTPNGKAALEAR